ncbi:hypothetical protein BJ508DRAFT_174873 [Ascobolus immersus RN42]|uniref:Histone H4 n=1 Tax=Ascobolus immersus RN42 TaxID=1160509 RepID=A0A3N4HVI2_ASCIM|nr:hypothetical protein BJ508DRAFT_174873 [Ascobolus immersus RN42]
MPPQSGRMGVGLGRGLGGRSSGPQTSGGKSGGKYATKGLKGIGRTHASRRQKVTRNAIKGITRGDIRYV